MSSEGSVKREIENLTPLEDLFEKEPKLNKEQRIAASCMDENILVLAGAGCGKTKTIIARAQFLIENYSAAKNVHILTFTRKASAEIVQRVKANLGEKAEGIKASTFHTWCMSLIRRSPDLFGCRDYSVIDREDQLSIFSFYRAASKYAKDPEMPRASNLLDSYSYTRNVGGTFKKTLEKDYPSSLRLFDEIKKIIISYEKRKETSKYLDYDDILEVVANQIKAHLKIREWVASQQNYLLVDEFQDTNPLQWKLINPLIHKVNLFCVGDDAQSIYGFRGADFENIHSFKNKISNATILKLTKNYRSTQEILDVSNWLLNQSKLKYQKELIAARGNGSKPELHSFINEWEEAEWIINDLKNAFADGKKWKENMILTRAQFAARSVEKALIEAKIPYSFIGGRKILESGHIKDVLSCLRVVANNKDDLSWMRFLKLFKGVGDVKASKLLDALALSNDIDDCITKLEFDTTIPGNIAHILKVVNNAKTTKNAFREGVIGLSKILEQKYKGSNWDKRIKDFTVVELLTEKFNTILEFIEAYLLEPLYETIGGGPSQKDHVTLITIHSAKGLEANRCYVISASQGVYPLSRHFGQENEIEEDRRVLYVALTRAKDQLFITRSGNQSAASLAKSQDEKHDLYFFSDLPENLYENKDHRYADYGNIFEEMDYISTKPSTNVDLE